MPCNLRYPEITTVSIFYLLHGGSASAFFKRASKASPVSRRLRRLISTGGKVGWCSPGCFRSCLGDWRQNRSGQWLVRKQHLAAASQHQVQLLASHQILEALQRQFIGHQVIPVWRLP